MDTNTESDSGWYYPPQPTEEVVCPVCQKMTTHVLRTHSFGNTYYHKNGPMRDWEIHELPKNVTRPSTVTLAPETPPKSTEKASEPVQEAKVGLVSRNTPPVADVPSEGKRICGNCGGKGHNRRTCRK